MHDQKALQRSQNGITAGTRKMGNRAGLAKKTRGLSQEMKKYKPILKERWGDQRKDFIGKKTVQEN